MHHDDPQQKHLRAADGALSVGSHSAVPLADLRPGQSGTVLTLNGGPGFVGRMAALGFTPGVEVKMVRNPGRGPLIVSVLDTHIALGRGQAGRVQVRPVA